ncbi:hypothetical protein OH77DRAFT_1526032 [Trametes cingulata]|nr:hypothetical protein OH77DRAFT_1526032 [Trametes cingulata]
MSQVDAFQGSCITCDNVQATQAQRMIRDLGGPIGVQSALGVGSVSPNTDLSQELRLWQQNVPHIICGTPQELHALFTSPGGLSGADVRFLVLDEVDQLIARNLHESVFGIIRLRPPPRSRALGTGANTPGASTPGSVVQMPFSNWEANGSSSSLLTPVQSLTRQFSGVSLSPPSELPAGQLQPIERQTALFSNTVPQDVLNLALAIQLREPTGLGIMGSGRGASNAETAQAREWKPDALADFFYELDIPQAIIHVGGMSALDAVVYKLSSRGLDAVPLDDRDRRNDSGLQAPPSGDLSRHSPSTVQAESDRAAYATFQNATQEANGLRNPEHTADGEETPGPTSGPIAMNGQLSATSSFYSQMSVRSRERMDTPPVIQESSSARTGHMLSHFVSSSPASSFDSGSHFAPSIDFSASRSFEAQLKASPLMNDVLDRLARLENTYSQIQRELGDVSRTVDILVEHAINSTPRMGGPIEFKDPFAPFATSSQDFVNSGLNGPRVSIANIAPNQSPLMDDITTISTRLNTLTSAVGQLLALQTQQIQANSGLFQNAQMLGGTLPQTDMSTALPPLLNTSASLGHGMPVRPDIRQSQRLPNPPMRTWSAGTFDIPMRNTDSPAGSMGRQDSIFRDKRRSVSGMLRRDSLGGESLSGGSSRDGGPVITQWEQLNLAPQDGVQAETDGTSRGPRCARVQARDHQVLRYFAMFDARMHVPELRRIAKRDFPHVPLHTLVVSLHHTVLPATYAVKKLATYQPGAGGTPNAEARDAALVERVMRNPDRFTLVEMAAPAGQGTHFVLTLATGVFWGEDVDDDGWPTSPSGASPDQSEDAYSREMALR